MGAPTPASGSTAPARDGLWDKLWHRWLRRPYRLHCATDIGRRDRTTVVLLHGLGRSAQVWEYLIPLLPHNKYRILAFDLLGFGASPKPDWTTYDVDDHARAVVASLRQRRAKAPVILVGHSMGCLIAARIASQHPELVRHLVLYEMPLYAGLPEKRLYRLRLNLYFGLYERITQFRPIFSGPGKGQAQRLAESIAGFTLSDETWKPFVKSLKHTIMEQTTDKDIRAIHVPIDVIYGSRDQLVFRGVTKLVFGEDVANVTSHTIRESHRISPKASAFLAERIRAAGSKGHTRREIQAGRRLPRRRRSSSGATQPKQPGQAEG